MSDLISRQAALVSYQNVCKGVSCDECPFLIKEGAFTDCRLERFIHELPSAQPEQAVKDCRNCKHGKYNDYHDTYFCYNAEDCRNWDKWETSAQPERLTDKEQRIFLAAMVREEKVCKQVDEECRDCREAYEDSLVSVCREIRRKVKGVLWTCSTDEDVPF